MRFLITGHTGFKGAWLTLMLLERGHGVSGIALDPEPGALFSTARLSQALDHDIRRDIRDFDGLRADIADIAPDVVVHMAAQPLVRASYDQPQETIETNVVGTMNVIESVRTLDCVQAQVIVTTDKVYRNIGQSEGYVEFDALGGHDPYSASKAAADLLTQSWVSSFELPPTAIVRAGNVIGGGDVSADRLLPDLLTAFSAGSPAVIRYPEAIRPWPHVLDCLTGYLAVTDALLAGFGQGAWNFGPGQQGAVKVSEVAQLSADRWNQRSGTSQARWHSSSESHSHEAAVLVLDASKAESNLGWRNRLDVSDAIDWTVDWAIRAQNEDPRAVTEQQIRAFMDFANF